VPWPENWEARYSGAACPMCGPESPSETEFGIRVHVGRFAVGYLSRRGPQRGYVVVIWHGPHVAEPTELTAEQAAGYFAEVLAVGDALGRHFGARKVNYEILGNTVPHLHTHVTARYAEGDVNPGAPLPKDRDVALDHDELEADAAALRALLGRGRGTADG
jgi:diadenosine tetraphosphate (Ap4A) HIT family hydrolase